MQLEIFLGGNKRRWKEDREVLLAQCPGKQHFL
jgi:hypothetical protein